MKELLKVSIRQEAIFLPVAAVEAKSEASSITTALITRMAEIGYGISQNLLHALNNTPVGIQQEILDVLQEIAGINKNWTPLVKEWNVPTGESFIDHFATFFANIFKAKGTTLDCGHIIPEGTFPLERYTGCPFCGTPFSMEKLTLRKQGSQLKVLDLWRETDIDNFFINLLQSKTALDATQSDSLKILLGKRPLPDCEISIKETLMLVADTLMSANRYNEVQKYFHTPNDILRFLWFRKTGFLQIISPKTILSRTLANKKDVRYSNNSLAITKLKVKQSLKLKYSRKESLAVAKWLNELNMSSETMCENMHPKRDMWVRFIRALRLVEYSKRKDFSRLAELLDRFHREDYSVLEGQVATYRMKYDVDNTLALLQSRPGLFSRSLFANMLWFGSVPVVEAFEEIIEKVPARLLLTLQMYAADYFSKENKRIVRPLGGIQKTIPSNKLVALYDEVALEKMQEAVAQLCLEAIKRRFSNVITNSKTIYIDEQLYNIPLSIGERSNTLQDVSSALTGTKFKVEGDCVRIFMQWGIGLSAQHMDMDLSCQIVYDDKTHYCSFSSLTPIGCKHSGDIRSIPENVGTAEYIEVDITTLRKANARFVAFGCNAYSAGALSPNMVVGWMNSKNHMHISETSGVAYDPSCVQHQVRITNGLQKGLLFGVLDVEQSTITWLELDFHGQIIQQIDHKTIPLMLKKLNSRISVGQLLEIKAIAQGLQIINTEKADEVYSLNWAKDSAAVTKLFID